MVLLMRLGAHPKGQRKSSLLSDAVEAVAGVAQTRHDVAVFVELFV